jgi:multidrug efflux system outer membrane protein
MAATRGLVRLAVPAAVALLGGCTTLGPDFQAPQVPWLQGWSGGAWRTLADEAPHSAQPRDDEWWRQFDDAVLDQLVAEAQRLNPGVRTAGLRILEARAQLGIAGSALYPQLQQVNAEALRVGNRGSDGRGTAFWSAGLAFDLAWELDFWGKFKRGRRRLLQQHRAVRRRAGASRGAGGEPVRDDPQHRTAAAHRQ